MKKYLYILFATCLFASCNTDNLFDDHWGSIRSEFEETNLSFVDVLFSAESWNIRSLYDIRYYTEPNGKGESFQYNNELTDVPIGAPIFVPFSLMLDNLRYYHQESAFPGILPDFYKDQPCRIDDDKILFDKVVLNSFDPIAGEAQECYYKILDYDESNILIETNSLFTEREGVKYPYAIIVLSKQIMEDSNWRDAYVPYEEWRELKHKLDEFLQNGGNAKDFRAQ